MIDADFVKEISDLSKVQEFVLPANDSQDSKIHHFTSAAVHELKAAPPPMLAKVSINTLRGFGDLVEEGLENLDKGKLFIHIQDHATVALIARTTDEYGRRQELVKATPVPFEVFPFGRWMSQEEFVIAVAARFSSTPDKEYVLRIASSLTNEAVAVSEDNGFSQKATIKSGMKMQETEVIKPTVSLAPFRTFPEVGQPISAFVFRAKAGQAPQLMLVEADGGKWKIDAINEVARVLSTFDLGIPVIA